MEKNENKTPETKSAPEQVKPEEIKEEVKTEEVKETKAEEVKETEEVKEAELTDKKVEKAIEEKPEEKEPETADEEEEAKVNFALTMKQIWVAVKGLFSKNAIQVISSQYREKNPIWLILVPAFVLLGASSQTATFNTTRDPSSVFFGILSKGDLASGEVFFITLAIEFIFILAFILGVRSFIKFHGGEEHFLNSANLVSAAALPVTFFSLLNILTGGELSFMITPLTELAIVAVLMMLFSGISAQIGGKKPIWSFFLMIIIVIAVTVVIAMVVISPIVFSSYVYGIIDNLAKT